MAAPLDDGIYSQRRALALKQYQDALLGLDTNWQQQQLLSGVNAKLDAQGNFAGYDANPLAQYGAFQKMLYGQSGNLDTLRNSAIERGIGRKGLARQGESDYRYQMGDERLQFGRGLTDLYSNWAGGRQKAKSLYDSSLLDIEQQRIRDSIQQGSFDEQPDPNSGNPSGYAQPKTPQAWTNSLYAKSDALNAKYKLGAYSKSAPQKSLAATSEALNRQYGLGAYAKSSIYYKKK